MVGYKKEFHLLRRPSQAAQDAATDRDLTGLNGTQQELNVYDNDHFHESHHFRLPLSLAVELPQLTADSCR